MSRDKVLDRLTEIRDEVDTLEQAAGIIGMQRPALDKVLERARKEGDPRAQWRGMGWRLGRRSTLTVEEAWTEIKHLVDGGERWDEAIRRVGVKPGTHLSGAINRLRKAGA